MVVAGSGVLSGYTLQTGLNDVQYGLYRFWDYNPVRCLDASCNDKVMVGLMMHVTRKPDVTQARASGEEGEASAACGGYSHYSPLDPACSNSALQLEDDTTAAVRPGPRPYGVDPAFNRWDNEQSQPATAACYHSRV